MIQDPTVTNDRHEQADGQSSTASKISTCFDICCVDRQVQLRTANANILHSPQMSVDTVTKSSGRGKKGKVWQIGEACRAVYSEDGEEYEGTVVNKNTANRSVVVRFHGYNNEEEMKERDLMESSGKDTVEQQDLT